MDYHPLGNTGLTVSVAGLGCGGNSRLGLGRGALPQHDHRLSGHAVEQGQRMDHASQSGTRSAASSQRGSVIGQK